MKTFDEIKSLFEQANKSLLEKDSDLFENQVSERTLCGALMLHLHDIINDDASYDGYHVDVEYNRNKGSIRTACKTIFGPEGVVRVNCDLILHSRGKYDSQDNLLAIEMKKSSRRNEEKGKDRERLIALTKDSFEGMQVANYSHLPEHVCRYVMGVYYEINYHHQSILMEYYQSGKLISDHIISYCKS